MAGLTVAGASTRVRVKVCGVTTPEDARLAVAMGADAIGLNFVRGSARAVAPTLAAEIVDALPPFATVVGVFADAEAPQLARVLRVVRLDCLQFHGDESPAFCRAYGIPYIKVAAMREGFDFAAFSERYCDAQALLLDTYDPVAKGGTGRAFDWSLWPCSARPLILAGGLTPDNVGAAIAATRPFAVDVASGVEGPVKGRKDARRLQRFMEAVADA